MVFGTLCNRLVIGCHAGLERFEEIDIKNGKILIATYCTEVGTEAINKKTTMPSVLDLQQNLQHEDSRMFLVFVGHSDTEGNMILKIGDDDTKEHLAPQEFCARLFGCTGTLTLCLYTCYGHKWEEAIRFIKNGGSRHFHDRLTINLRFCTQQNRDVANDKILYYQMKDYYPQIVGEQSSGEDGKGHSCLHDDIQKGASLPLTSF